MGQGPAAVIRLSSPCFTLMPRTCPRRHVAGHAAAPRAGAQSSRDGVHVPRGQPQPAQRCTSARMRRTHMRLSAPLPSPSASFAFCSRMDANHTSNTAYGHDNYSQDYQHPQVPHGTDTVCLSRVTRFAAFLPAHRELAVLKAYGRWAARRLVERASRGVLSAAGGEAAPSPHTFPLSLCSSTPKAFKRRWRPGCPATIPKK